MSANLFDKQFLLTSGPTFAPIDAVRSITNHSSGRLGSAIAFALLRQGAEVHQLAGETSLTPLELDPDQDLSRLRVTRFRTVPELKELIRRTLSDHPIQAVLMAAAVLDYIPIAPVEGKKASNEEEWVVRLRRGEKIIEQIRSWSPDVLIVGFKLESRISREELTARAWGLLVRSDAKWVVANRLEEIRSDHHVGYIVERRDGEDRYSVSSPLNTREAIAEALVERLAATLNPKVEEKP